MIDLDDPIEFYRSELQVRHQQIVVEAIDDLIRQSGVDAVKNKITVSELRKLESDHGREKSLRKKWIVIRVALAVVAGAAVLLAIFQRGIFLLSLLPAALAILFLLNRVNPTIFALNESLKELSGRVRAKRNEAIEQMAPLNALHKWNVAALLMQKTCPNFVFDRYLTAARLEDLQNNFDLEPEFNNGLSICALQSGTFNQNPFLLARYKRHWMGTRSYTGSLTIRWTESERDVNGKMVDRMKTQVLTASVVKPFPEYQVVSKLLYGHDAAPNLSFSRSPSKLSATKDGEIAKKKVDRTIKKVERQARKAVKAGGRGLTVMSNRDFEALFKATDRTNETEFRLLFTPLAQQTMLDLLTDSSTGYGDDFYFTKYGKLNLVESEHLNKTRFDDDPSMFHSLDLEKARKFFIDFHCEYFRSIYFAFAPLLAVPMYRDERQPGGTQLNSLGAVLSDWEHEIIANHIGANEFKHQESVTENVIRAYSRGGDNASNVVDVIAFGYAGLNRVDYVPVRGADGNLHSVPVSWVEYVPVSQESVLVIGALKSPALDFSDDESQELRNEWERSTTALGLSLSDVHMRNGVAALIISA
jgi:hypothetical protein